MAQHEPPQQDHSSQSLCRSASQGRLNGMASPLLFSLFSLVYSPSLFISQYLLLTLSSLKQIGVTIIACILFFAARLVVFTLKPDFIIDNDDNFKFNSYLFGYWLAEVSSLSFFPLLFSFLSFFCLEISFNIYF